MPLPPRRVAAVPVVRVVHRVRLPMQPMVRHLPRRQSRWTCLPNRPDRAEAQRCVIYARDRLPTPGEHSTQTEKPLPFGGGFFHGMMRAGT
jgi:hypothetical protein